mmetsp:Transcript_5698/g.10469  ORF Transcript_5698/g.10469 Transcript_5698/m.10469 type:complete len:98 (+) Transcript_5698:346-639(+)
MKGSVMKRHPKRWKMAQWSQQAHCNEGGSEESSVYTESYENVVEKGAEELCERFGDNPASVQQESSRRHPRLKGQSYSPWISKKSRDSNRLKDPTAR